MEQHEKIRLARQVMQISGLFTLVVALLLLINFLQMSQHEPLESKALEAMVERLAEEPGNEELIGEIRDFDLVVRKAYFTSRWQIRTGAILLLAGAVCFAFALKVYSGLKQRIGEPSNSREEYLLSRRFSLRWLLITGGVIFLLAMSSAFLTDNYLDDYVPEMAAAPPIQDETMQNEEPIEIITITETVDPEGDDLTTNEEPPRENDTGADTEAGSPVPEAVRAENAYGFEVFKQHHNSFRGPFSQGIAYHKNIPVEWDGSTGTNVLWKVSISWPGYNSPVIWGDRLFITGATDEARVVSCYDRHTGQLLWERRADNIPGSPSKMPDVTDDTGLAAPTAATDGYRVYAIFATGDIIAFDMQGNRVWARNLGVPRNHYGHSSSLVVFNKKVIVQYDTGTGGRMLALNVLTGETEWDIRRDNNISWASPVLVDHAGVVQVVTNTDPLVAGYDLETGEEIWKVSAMMGEVGPSVAYDDGIVFANNEYASLVAINAAPGASIVWENYDYLSEAASPVAHDGLLYLATSYGVFVCYDAATGEQVWEMDFGNQIYSSPMIADGRIYMMDNTGIMHIVKADRSGTMIAAPELGEPSYAVPAFAEGRIYIRGSESLYCIGK